MFIYFCFNLYIQYQFHLKKQNKIEIISHFAFVTLKKKDIYLYFEN